MRCVMCKRGLTKPGGTSVLLTHDNFTLAVREVPAEICEVCGEDYTDEDVSKHLYHMAETMQHQGTVRDVRKYKIIRDNLCPAEG